MLQKSVFELGMKSYTLGVLYIVVVQYTFGPLFFLPSNSDSESDLILNCKHVTQSDTVIIKAKVIKASHAKCSFQGEKHVLSALTDLSTDSQYNSNNCRSGSF